MFDSFSVSRVVMNGFATGAGHSLSSDNAAVRVVARDKKEAEETSNRVKAELGTTSVSAGLRPSTENARLGASNGPLRRFDNFSEQQSLNNWQDPRSRPRMSL